MSPLKKTPWWAESFAIRIVSKLPFGCRFWLGAMEKVYKLCDRTKKHSTKIFNKISFQLWFRRIVGPVNSKNPSEGFAVQLWLLQLGLWTPGTNNVLIQTLYTIWSYFYRWFFLYLYTLTQILFFLNVEDLMVTLSHVLQKKVVQINQ